MADETPKRYCLFWILLHDRTGPESGPGSSLKVVGKLCLEPAVVVCTATTGLQTFACSDESHQRALGTRDRDVPFVVRTQHLASRVSLWPSKVEWVMGFATLPETACDTNTNATETWMIYIHVPVACSSSLRVPTDEEMEKYYAEMAMLENDRRSRAHTRVRPSPIPKPRQRQPVLAWPSAVRAFRGNL